MRWKSLWISTGLCFGLGLGLASSERSARACSPGTPFVKASLVSIDGDGDLAGEQAYWDVTMTIEDWGGESIYAIFEDGRDGPELQRTR